ncbi:hypothetical protein Vadar_008951 [Vaccinium darrowii]|uniref:Uncharacterized protein n=1 Tax=Vaccinium darrowii TaxID=229202 RepID=A0ACB7YCR4_9ERIC|nr:hypothetical protein Vadar_008951 [Vaccinium darrowii]
MHQLLRFLAAFFFLVSQIPMINGDIKTITISSDSRRTIFLKDFCFDHTGHVTLNLTNVSVTTTSTTPINSSRIGVYFGDQFDIQYYTNKVIFREGVKTCVVESPFLIPGGFEPIATFDELSPQYSVNKTLPIPVFTINNETLPVPTRDHLDECYENRRFIRKIHVLMTILVIFKSLNLFFEAEEKHYIKVTGTPHGWDLWMYLFYSLKALLLITIIMLIGSGWTIMKPVLQAKEKKVLAVGIAIQLVGTIAHIFSDEFGPSNSQYLYSTIVFFLVDCAGFYVVYTPIYSSAQALKEAAKTDGSAARDLGKLRLLASFNNCLSVFWAFKWMAWLYFHQISPDNCGLEWLVVTSVETVTFGFYIGFFELFRPREQNEYFAVEEEFEDEEMVLDAIEDEFQDI